MTEDSPQYTSLTPGVVSEIVMQQKYEWLQFVAVDGAAPVSFTTNGTDPVITGPGTYPLPATAGGYITLRGPIAPTHVKFISSGATQVMVRGFNGAPPPVSTTVSSGGTTGGTGGGDVTSGQLSAEQSARIAADAAEATARANAVSAETTRAQAAEATAQPAATAATDAELASETSRAQAAEAAAQPAATAATDAELASEASTRASAVSAETTRAQAAEALAQPAATAATDAELATETSRAQAAEALAQPASTAATDEEVAAAVLQTVVAWQPNTNYPAGKWVIAPGGYPAQAKATFTSGNVYLAANWNEFPAPAGPAGQSEISSAKITASYALSGTASQPVSNWPSLIVPAGVACDLDVKGGVFFQVVTGTSAAGTAITLYIKVMDDLGGVPCFSQQVWGKAVAASETLNYVLPLGGNVDAQAADRTYHVEVRMSLTGVLGGTCSVVNGGGIFPNRVLQALRR